MKKPKKHEFALFVAALALNATAQPVLVYSSPGQAFASASLSNLRIHDPSPDKTELILTVDFSYDGLNGETARIVPVITDKKHPKISRWFGANAVDIGPGRGAVSLRVKYFRDEPGAPRQLSTDHVKILMLTEAGSVINAGLFGRAIEWGGPGPSPAPAQAPAAQASSPPSKTHEAEEKSKVTNVEVAHRNFDRTEITVSVEYQYENKDRTRKMGIELVSAGEKGASAFFSSPAVDLSRGSRGVAFFPVKFNPVAGHSLKHPTLRTDMVRVYLIDANGAKSYIHESVMPVVWNVCHDGLAGANLAPAG